MLCQTHQHTFILREYTFLLTNFIIAYSTYKLFFFWFDVHSLLENFRFIKQLNSHRKAANLVKGYRSGPAIYHRSAIETMDLVDIQAMESKLNDVTVTAIPMTNKLPQGLTVSQHPSPKSHFHQQPQSVTIQSSKLEREHNLQQYRQQKQLHQQMQQEQARATVASMAKMSSEMSTAANYSYSGGSQSSLQSQSTNATIASMAKMSSEMPLSAAANYSYNGGSQTLSQSQPTNANMNANGMSKYAQLLSIIEEIGRHIRPTYANSRSSCDNLKRNIAIAKVCRIWWCDNERLVKFSDLIFGMRSYYLFLAGFGARMSDGNGAVGASMKLVNEAAQQQQHQCILWKRSRLNLAYTHIHHHRNWMYNVVECYHKPHVIIIHARA